MRKKSNKTPRESSGAFRKMAIVIFAPAAILLVLVLILTGINYYSISNSTKKIIAPGCEKLFSIQRGADSEFCFGAADFGRQFRAYAGADFDRLQLRPGEF